MRRQRIEHHATTTADPATVYALLRDGASWPSWSPIESFALERPGADQPEGVGAVREFRNGRVTGHDEIVELIPNRRISYAHTSNLPISTPSSPARAGCCAARSTASSPSSRAASPPAPRRPE